jgi:TonB family protein
MKRSILNLLAVFFITGIAFSQSTTSGDEALVIQHADMPLYPGMAKVARISGTVRVEVTVKDGSVVNITVLQSSAPILVNATTDNLKTWKFMPKANAKFITTYVYVLEKKQADFPENPRIQMQLPNLVKITVRPTKPTCMDCGSVPRQN